MRGSSTKGCRSGLRNRALKALPAVTVSHVTMMFQDFRSSPKADVSVHRGMCRKRSRRIAGNRFQSSARCYSLSSSTTNPPTGVVDPQRHEQ